MSDLTSKQALLIAHSLRQMTFVGRQPSAIERAIEFLEALGKDVRRCACGEPLPAHWSFSQCARCFPDEPKARKFTPMDRDALREKIASDPDPDAQIGAGAPQPPTDTLLARYEAWIETIALGQEDRQRGTSAYNWHRAALAQLRRIAGEPETKPGSRSATADDFHHYAEEKVADLLSDETSAAHFDGRRTLCPICKRNYISGDESCDH